MFWFMGLGCIPLIVTPILAINYFSNMNYQNEMRNNYIKMQENNNKSVTNENTE